MNTSSPVRRAVSRGVSLCRSIYIISASCTHPLTCSVDQLQDNMPLKVYLDRLSQPCRAVLLLLKANDVPFEEVVVSLLKSKLDR